MYHFMCEKSTQNDHQHVTKIWWKSSFLLVIAWSRRYVSVNENQQFDWSVISKTVNM